ncbi:thiamine pyrophosphate-dependent enzyme [Streptomyces sp. NPDC050085]|uniref:thiamine pyrophosphate-dependent enzyme n=1 Tax=Streptomyces sp. NPDC050085 TaxID=3365600 RepID=UPI0037A35A05
MSIHDPTTAQTSRLLDDTSANRWLIDALAELGVTAYAGVNGGGVIHLARLLAPGTPGADTPSLFTVPEYTAGFMPLGHHLAGGGIAACLTTTGAASKLAASGLSDAKAHNIPAVYLVALNSTATKGLSPLQDVSDDGAGMVAQLRAELGDACLHVKDRAQLPGQLQLARRILADSRPVVFALHPDVLAGPAPDPMVPLQGHPRHPPDVNGIHRRIAGRRVVVLATDEAARDPHMPELTARLTRRWGAPIVWTVNGAAAVDPRDPYGHGHIGFGGNDVASALFTGLGPDDVLLTLGFEPGEYVLNLARVTAGHVIHLTALTFPYGQGESGFAHRCAGTYERITGPISSTLEVLLSRPGAGPQRQRIAPAHLNSRTPEPLTRPGTVDFAAFLERLALTWTTPAFAFDDVCMAYKDRQYVFQRPHPHIRSYAAYQGSAMGGAFGLALGAKLARPDLSVLCFSGDGCFRLYAGALPETAHLGLRLFILNNGAYAIVNQGLPHIMPGTPEHRFHGDLAPVDFVTTARGLGWDAIRCDPDLGNLDAILTACQAPGGRSLLVEVPVDPGQEIGHNPRVHNLTRASYL